MLSLHHWQASMCTWQAEQFAVCGWLYLKQWQAAPQKATKAYHGEARHRTVGFSCALTWTWWFQAKTNARLFVLRFTRTNQAPKLVYITNLVHISDIHASNVQAPIRSTLISLQVHSDVLLNSSTRETQNSINT